MAEETDLFLALKEDYREALERLNEALLLLEREPENRDALGAATRQLHNIKGFANRMGAPKLGQMAHILEDIFAASLDGRFPFDDSLADLLFRGLDLFVHYLRTRDVPTDQVALLVEESEGLLFPASEREAAGLGNLFRLLYLCLFLLTFLNRRFSLWRRKICLKAAFNRCFWSRLGLPVCHLYLSCG